MALGAGLLRRSWKWFYCWLQIFLYWVGKLAGSSVIRFRRLLLKSGEKKSLLNLGRRILELHQNGREDWVDEPGVQEVLRVLADSGRKREELVSRVEERKNSYRQNVQRFKARLSSPTTESEVESPQSPGGTDE